MLLPVKQHYQITMSVYCHQSVTHPDMTLDFARTETNNQPTNHIQRYQPIFVSKSVSVRKLGLLRQQIEHRRRAPIPLLTANKFSCDGYISCHGRILLSAGGRSQWDPYYRQGT